ncbi:F-box protein CPR1-like [Salvia miltiorrhiza]|uniref:F-box protein CPR1-like n=1 Tax=Salvia miltiorrhiza TaxID=226208 RepID=UPI0025ACC562|nr:F-box protein CPR1-like [Salvia miltiorrhiza]
MEPDLFTNVPLEIMSNILSRLPLRSIVISKCVCKPWLHLLETDDFVKSHLSKPALAVLAQDSTLFAVFNLEDEDGVDLESHDLHYNPVTDFDIPYSRGATTVEATSANGLLLIFSKPETLYICNPLYAALKNPAIHIGGFVDLE